MPAISERVRKIFSQLKSLPKQSSFFLKIFSPFSIKNLMKRFILFNEKSIFPQFTSVNFEISVIYTFILGLVLLAFSGIFYVITSQTLYSELDNQLLYKAKSISENIDSYLKIKGEEPQTLRFAVESTIAHEDRPLRRWWYIGFERGWFQRLDEQDLSEDFISFISLDQSMQVNSKNLDENLRARFVDNRHLEGNKEIFWNLDLDHRKIRVINYPFPNPKAPTHIIQIGISKGPIILLLSDWMRMVFMSIPVILILTGFIGSLLASRILRPLNKIINTANKITYENLNLRIEPRYQYKEMNNLIQTFNEMVGRLEKSFKHIDEFSAHAAHELKTPLTIIRGETELALIDSKSRESRQAMRTIITEIDSMLRTIDGLLFLSKANYQPETFDFQDADLVALIEEVADNLKLIAQKKGVQLQFHHPHKDYLVRADALHLKRLFYNLLDNAIKYTDKKGKVTISLSTSKHRDVYVHITDTGQGIPDADLPKIFDQFYRAEGSRKGVGLGLSIAQSIAKAHHGEIRVESQLSQGTTFTVILPVLPSPTPAFV